MLFTCQGSRTARMRLCGTMSRYSIVDVQHSSFSCIFSTSLILGFSSRNNRVAVSLSRCDGLAGLGPGCSVSLSRFRVAPAPLYLIRRGGASGAGRAHRGLTLWNAALASSATRKQPDNVDRLLPLLPESPAPTALSLIHI